MDLPGTRAIINAILDGSIEKAEFETMPIFNLQIPKALKGVDTKFLNPRNSWPNPGDWDIAAKNLAQKFIKNFENFTDNEAGRRLIAAGPQI
jgi:phosphoenolpyruvate carboxykinase (ATP)